jgi:hypothetical protein
MLFAQIRTEPVEAPEVPDKVRREALQLDNRSLERQVQKGLNVWLPMKNPMQMPALIQYLRGALPGIHKVLGELHYIHFARFMPNPDGTIMWVVTEYDGGLDSYIMDFVGLVGQQFTEILQFIHEAPPLPVQSYPREFVKYINDHNLPVTPWSAYPSNTVLDIQRSARRM